MNEKIQNIKEFFNKARRKLKNAKEDIMLGDYEDAASRAYYAAFHSISAVLFEMNLVFSSHSQTIGAFNRELVKKNIFPENFPLLINKLFEDRQIGDYSVSLIIDEDTARRCVNDAETILKACEEYLAKKTGVAFWKE